MKFNNKYYLLRHGEARSNYNKIFSSYPETFYNPLTDYGKLQIREITKILKNEKIDLIFASDLLRIKQTAKIVTSKLNLKANFDKKLREIDFGIFNGQPEENWNGFFKNEQERYTKRPKNGENFRDIRKRCIEFLKSVESKYKNKKILVISHGGILLELYRIFNNLTEQEVVDNRKKLLFKKGELRIVN